MPEDQTPGPTDASTWTSPIPFEVEGPLPTPESLLEGPVYAMWHQPMYESTELKEELGWVEMCLPGTGSFDVNFDGNVQNIRYLDWDGGEDEIIKTMTVGTVIIPRELDGNKIGEKLMRGLIYEAVKSGCKEMKVDFKHPASFKAFLRAVGFDRMTFPDLSSVQEPTEEQILKRFEDWSPKGSRPKLLNIRSTEAVIDLEGLDTSEWEVPEEFQVPADADEL